MKKEKSILTENHRRSLTSALTMVEKMLIEMEHSLTTIENYCLFYVNNDMDREDILFNLDIIVKAREQICKIAEKYGAGKRDQSLRKTVNAKKTKIWEILCDVRSKKQKGFGEFPKELAKEYDGDIEELIALTEKIKF